HHRQAGGIEILAESAAARNEPEGNLHQDVMAIFSRRAVTMAAAFAAGLAARTLAQEKTADTAASASPPESVLARAKAEFADIKSYRETTLQPRREFPSVAMPSLQTESSPTIPVKQLKAPMPDAKSENWLLDAFRKQSEPKGTRTKADRREETEAKKKSGDLDL